MIKNGCVGTYSVSGYTRGDGVSVSSYTRTCGAAHASSNYSENNQKDEKETPLFKLGIEYEGERKPNKKIGWKEQFLKKEQEEYSKMINRANLFYPNMPEAKRTKIESILKNGIEEFENIEKERLINQAKNYAGATLELASGLIPSFGGLKATALLAKTFKPILGKKISNTFANSIVNGTALSGVYGLGEGLLQDKNAFENAINSALFGGITASLTGLGTGKIVKYIERNKILSNPENKELILIFINDYLEDLLNKKPVLREVRSLRQGIIKGKNSNLLDSLPESDTADLLKKLEKLARNLKNGKYNPLKRKEHFVKMDRQAESMSQNEMNYITHELNTNLTNRERKSKVIRRAIGDHVYTVKNNGFNNYNFLKKEKIDDLYNR